MGPGRSVGGGGDGAREEFRERDVAREEWRGRWGQGGVEGEMGPGRSVEGGGRWGQGGV